MSISVFFIEGNRKSACRNNAFSIVRNDSELLAIIPCAELKSGQTRNDLATAFNKALQDRPQAPVKEIRRAAYATLGLTCG